LKWFLNYFIFCLIKSLIKPRKKLEIYCLSFFNKNKNKIVWWTIKFENEYNYARKCINAWKNFKFGKNYSEKRLKNGRW